MFQIAFGIPTDSVGNGWWLSVFRDLFLLFDKVVYTFISFLYQIIFYIADADLFSSKIIIEFYQRIYVVLGVFMIFKLSISVLQIIMNPELMNDKKKGIGQIITRILVMVAMLTAIMPLNGIPEAAAPEKSYNDYLKKHGVLFGTLYSMQYRILSNNVIGKLVVGDSYNKKNPNAYVTSAGASDSEKFQKQIEESGNRFSGGILKGFIRPNLKEDGSITDTSLYVCQPDETIDKELPWYESLLTGILDRVIDTVTLQTFTVPFTNFVTGSDFEEATWAEDITKWISNRGQGKVSDTYLAWFNEETSPDEITDLANQQCSNGYVLAYLPLVSTAIGVFCLLLLIGYCLDLGIRTIKLAILRLVAPIAIISYIDPQSSEKGAFANWLKLLIHTYLDLFVRLIILYLVVFFTDAILSGEIALNFTGNFIDTIAKILLIISLFYFARQAPKFISDALGIKSAGFGVGLSGVFGGLGAVMGGAGIRGFASGFMNASQDAAEAAAQGKAAPPAFGAQRDRIAQLRTGDKNARGGIFGNLQRAANDRTNNALARRLFGMDRAMNDAAKKEMFRVKGIASAAEERYKRFTTGNMSASERSTIEKGSAFMDYLKGKHITNYDAQDESVKNNLMTQFLEDVWGDKQTAANKQESWYKDSSKILEGFNLHETPQEKYMSTRTGRYTRGITHGMEAGISRFADNNLSDHPRVAGVVNRAGNIVGSVGQGAGQRRGTRLGTAAPKNERGYGVSFQHRDDSDVGENDKGKV